jgi:NAD(P)-dependent dehydrogenase (short-subunit alcohol dehydrogenase family)
MGALDGKVVVLTGVGAGLGRQFAIRLAREGAKLALCDLYSEKAAETAKLAEAEGAEVLAVCDVSKPEELKAYIDQTIERFGTVDVLINNANFQADLNPFLDQTEDELDAALHVGVYAHWRVMKLCYPYLKGKSSSIINFFSGVGTVEWGKDGIRVNNISPSALTDTIQEKLSPEFTQWAIDALSANAAGRPGDPLTDIAPLVVFLASDESRWISGQNINVDGGELIRF